MEAGGRAGVSGQVAVRQSKVAAATLAWRISGRFPLIAAGTPMALAGDCVRRCRRESRGTALRVQEARASEPGAAPAGARASGAVPGVHARALPQASSEVRRARAQGAAALWGPVARVHARPVPSLPARVLRGVQLRSADGVSVVLGPAHGRGERALDGSSPA